MTFTIPQVLVPITLLAVVIAFLVISILFLNLKDGRDADRKNFLSYQRDYHELKAKHDRLFKRYDEVNGERMDARRESCDLAARIDRAVKTLGGEEDDSEEEAEEDTDDDKEGDMYACGFMCKKDDAVAISLETFKVRAVSEDEAMGKAVRVAEKIHPADDHNWREVVVSKKVEA